MADLLIIQTVLFNLKIKHIHVVPSLKLIFQIPQNIAMREVTQHLEIL